MILSGIKDSKKANGEGMKAMDDSAFKVHIMTSNRHVHLSEESVAKLFGEAGLTFQRKANEDTTTFVCNETVTLEGPKGSIANVRVLGPFRYNQAELLITDNFKLGLEAPVRMSGDLDGAAEIRIIGPKGSVEFPCAIVARRHIHIGADLLEKYGFTTADEVSVRIDSYRGGVLDHVLFKKAKNPGDSATMHIDTEEGNAFGLGRSAEGIVLPKKR